MAPNVLHLTGDAEADELLSTDPFALLIGMLLDQQVPMEKAFRSPYDLKERLGGPARRGRDRRPRPRGPGRHLRHARRPSTASRAPWRPAPRPWPGRSSTSTTAWPSRSGTTAATGPELYQRLKALPGFGDQKARIFLALLAKRLGVQPPGWEEAAGPYAADGFYSVADIDSPESLAKVREYKKAKKAAAKAKASDPRSMRSWPTATRSSWPRGRPSTTCSWPSASAGGG